MILALTQRAAGSDTSVADTLGGQASPLDSVTLANPPLPSGLAAFVRFVFHVPQWIQIGGAILGALVAAALLVIVWRRRRQLREWGVTRSRGVKIALAGTVATVLMVVAGTGWVSWDYMQHNNDFCNGCHVMAPAFGRFQTSEHRKLGCHDCHRQSIVASAKQLYFWVLDRPREIPPHAKVPTEICAECHIQEQPDSVWQQISSTAGHKVHLVSDSSALRDVQCVTCHGVEVHKFAPVDETCGQSQCHERTEIRLAKMRGQTSLHCVTCHEFTRPIPQHVSADSAGRTIVPRETECLSCHDMREKLRDFDPRAEPHDAVCGTCHDPHTQESPQAAFSTCESAGCHARADTVTAFHRGLPPGTLADCGECHTAHTWQVSGEKCLDCHADIFRDRPQRANTPRRTSERATPAGPVAFSPVALGENWAPAPHAQTPQAGRLGYAGPEPFSHREHRRVECTSCHRSGERHGELTVRTVRDCQSCHHEPQLSENCSTCHASRELRGTDSVATRLALSVFKSPMNRRLPFRHDRHAEVQCGVCHTTPVTLDAGRGCESCHEQHHTVEPTCRACHSSGKPTHTREAHLGCAGSGCHTSQGTVALEPVRNVCLTCHQNLVDHRPGRECAQCHQVRWLAGPRGAGRR